MPKTQYDATDPRDAYPRPPFPSQPQDSTGSIFDMKPQPDHGEESYKGFGRMKGRKALVTGGDSGIGRAAAIAFAREGADVAISCLHPDSEDAKSTLELLKSEGVNAQLYGADNSDEQACIQLIADVVRDLGGIDVLVNNAGMQKQQPKIEDLDSDQFVKTFQTNVFGTFWLCKSALKYMEAGDAIINVTSSQAYDPSPQLLDYASTKFALRGFTQALAAHVIERGIRVNAIAPGPFWTALQPSGGQTDEKVQHFGEGAALGRPGQPAEIGPAFVFLATNESSYMTGETIGQTGGKPIA